MKEEEENGKKLREARKNLESGQQRVNKQTTPINDLEGKKNKLVNKQLDIEGKQQQRANMIRKRMNWRQKLKPLEKKRKLTKKLLSQLRINWKKPRTRRGNCRMTLTRNK